jgi:S-formylglutathione hydrolase FrmB
MSLCQINSYSKVLGTAVSVNVIYPDVIKTKKEVPVLYLLHGLLDDHSMWIRKTSIERYVENMELAVVMPGAGRSFYTDMVHGYRYYSYICDELPEIICSMFRISDKPEDKFIAGLSMGGYGAFKIALDNPLKYSAAASLSGVLDISGRILKERLDERRNEFTDIFGAEEIEGTKHDLFHLVQSVSGMQTKPKLYQCCGTDDFLYKDNIAFRDFMYRYDFDYTYEDERGIHDWEYWDKKIKRVLEWII